MSLRSALPLIPLQYALSVRRKKRRLGATLPLRIKHDPPRYRWVDGEWVKR